VSLITVAIAPTLATALKWRQDNRISKEQRARDEVAAAKVEAVAVKAEETAAKVEAARVDLVLTTSRVDAKLDGIHTLVNSRLTDALARLDEVRAMLVAVAPHDPRVQRLMSAVEGTLAPLPAVPVDDARLGAAKEAAALILHAAKVAADKLAAEEKAP
jgi:hypothetical protein